MDLTRLTEEDLFGRFFLRASSEDTSSGYYRSLEAIRPLVTSREWLNSVTGFYINVTDNHAVRLSFFTAVPDPTLQLVQRFMAEHGLASLKAPELPHDEKVSSGYGGEELRFRRFLSTYTLIALDIMKADLLNARCLFVTFRWQVMRARQPYKPHFLGTFESQSPFYNSLSESDKGQFWRDLEHWPNPPQVDWAHMFVNMVVPGDWNGPGQWENFLELRPPLSIPQINALIRNEGFQIPENWRA